jgi:hypothetical protein
MDQRNDLVVGYFSAGAIDDAGLNRLIARAWTEAVLDPVDSASIASILGVPPDRLRDAPPPVVAEVLQAGITGAEMVLLFAAAFAGAFAKDLGSAAGKSASAATMKLVRKVWERVLWRRIRAADPEALGEERLAEEDL